MITKMLSDDEVGIAQAAQELQAGQVVGIPTETVYGLAANALDEAAVQRIFAAKGRPQDNPLIVHISSLDMLEKVVDAVPAKAYRLAEAFWPGPLTMVLPTAAGIAPSVTAGLGTVGVRLPVHPAARAVIRAAGVPLAAPSANKSGSPSPTTAQHVLQDMQGKIRYVLDGGACPVGVESTVLTLVGEPMVLRPGFVTAAEIAEILGQPVGTVGGDAYTGSNSTPPSPGMKYKHYAPNAEITIIDSELNEYIAYLAKLTDVTNTFALCFEGEEALLDIPCVTYGKADDAPSQAAALFAALRRLDALGAKTVYARRPAQDGVGLAVRNRLLRAASFREIKL